MLTVSTFCQREIDILYKINIKNIKYTILVLFTKERNIDNIIYVINMKYLTTNCPCGSGKKYKNCCGRNK